MFPTRIVLAGAALLLGAGICRADFEADLLKKFQKENQATAEKVKTEVANALGQAAGLRVSHPDKAEKLLAASVDMLEKDTHLSRVERGDLLRKLRDELAALKGLVASRKKDDEKAKLDSARTELHRDKYAGLDVKPPPVPPLPTDDPAMDPKRSPIFFTPTFTPVPINSSFTTTPVVSPDRRYVRIGVNQGFMIPRFNFVPVPIVTPTILQGPGKGVTVTNPIVIKQVMVTVPSFITGSINTTVVAPDGGTAFAGGSSSFFESRNEFGTPILGHMPYVNRLFKNVGYGSSINAFRIGVSPRIIIMEEEERRLFGD